MGLTQSCYSVIVEILSEYCIIPFLMRNLDHGWHLLKKKFVLLYFWALTRVDKIQERMDYQEY